MALGSSIGPAFASGITAAVYVVRSVFIVAVPAAFMFEPRADAKQQGRPAVRQTRAQKTFRARESAV